MQRWHREKHIAKRHQREHLRFVYNWPEQPVDCVCDRQIGRFRKRDGLDCGRPRCYLCHGYKLLKLKRRSDRIADLKLQEGLNEINGR